MRKLLLTLVAGLSFALLPQSAKADHHAQQGLCPAVVACPYLKPNHPGHWGRDRWGQGRWGRQGHRWGHRGQRWGRQGRRWGNQGRRWGKRAKKRGWNKQRKMRKLMRAARKAHVDPGVDQGFMRNVGRLLAHGAQFARQALGRD